MTLLSIQQFLISAQYYESKKPHKQFYKYNWTDIHKKTLPVWTHPREVDKSTEDRSSKYRDDPSWAYCMWAIFYDVQLWASDVKNQIVDS